MEQRACDLSPEYLTRKSRDTPGRFKNQQTRHSLLPAPNTSITLHAGEKSPQRASFTEQNLPPRQLEKLQIPKEWMAKKELVQLPPCKVPSSVLPSAVALKPHVTMVWLKCLPSHESWRFHKTDASPHPPCIGSDLAYHLSPAGAR